MFHLIEPYIALLLMLATAVFAFWKGGQPERFGAGMIVVTWIGTVIAQAPGHQAVWIFMVFDGLLAVGFLVVAVRYSSLWLGGAMICQAVSFGAHALRLSDDARTGHSRWVFILVINVISYLVLLILVGGTCATILRRRKADRAKVEDRARAVRRPDWLTDATPPSASIP